jgi:hypothetical protein
MTTGIFGYMILITIKPLQETIIGSSICSKTTFLLWDDGILALIWCGEEGIDTS